MGQRFSLDDSTMEVFIKFSGGNPGALNVLTNIMRTKGDKLVQYLITLDTMELYEDKLYMLWNDCCDRDVRKVLKILDYYEEGKITQKNIDERIKNVGYGISFDDLLGKEV